MTQGRPTPAYTRRGTPLPGPDSAPTYTAQAATYNPDGSFAGWATPVAQDANGDVTVPGDLTVSGGSTVFGDGSQDIRLTSVVAANRLDTRLTRIISTSGQNPFTQCYLNQGRFVEVAWPSAPISRHLKGADADAYVIGQGQVNFGPTAGIPTQRYLTYDTLNKMMIAGVPVRPAGFADDDAPNDTIYKSTDAGKLVYKDSDGNINALY